MSQQDIDNIVYIWYHLGTINQGVHTMYTIEITFKFYSMFHSGVASLESAKNLAENYATFPGASAVVVKNDKTGKIEYTIEQ